MRLSIFSFLIVAFFNQFCFGQSGKSIFYNTLNIIKNKDSVENIWLRQDNDSFEKLNLLLSLEKSYYIESSSKCGSLLDSIKRIEVKLYQNNTSGLYSFFLANTYTKANKIYDAYNSYNEAIQKFKINKDSFGLANSLISLSSILMKKDLTNTTSQELLEEAERIALQINDTKLIIRLYMAYLKLYLSENQKENDNDLINKIVDKLKKAIKGKKDESWGLAYFNTNMGTINSANKKYEDAINNYKVASFYYKDINDESGIMLNYYNMALAYFYLNDFTNSTNTVDLALKIANKNHFLTDKKNCYYLKTEIFRSTNQLENCLIYYDSLFIIKDSLILNEKMNELNEIRTKYHAQQLELTNENLKIKQLNNQKIKNILLVFLLFAFLAICTFIYLYVKTLKQKIKISNQNVALEDLTRTKDYFLSIIAHDIKQPIISLFSLNKTLKYFANLKDFDRVDKIINSFDKSSMKTLKIIDNLFHWSFIQNQNSIYQPEKIFFKSKMDEIISRFILEDIELEINIPIDNQIFIYFNVSDFEILMRNLIDNSIKYAKVNEKTKILIELISSEKENEVCIHYKDFGLGMNQEMIDKTNKIFEDPTPYHPKVDNMGFGIILISKLIKMNNSNIYLKKSSYFGTEYILNFNKTI